MIINVGYDKAKGGFYWKPADISIKKGIKNE
jgi:arabinogalactan endo-1,4-beta-galactosidase